MYKKIMFSLVVIISIPLCGMSQHEKDTALGTVACNGDVQQVEALLDQGADINNRQYFGRTPLDLASRGRHDAVMRLLLARGAEVNLCEFFTSARNTPLLAVSALNYMQGVRLLLDYGADIDISNDYGEVPLHAAATRGHSPIVSLLLRAGSNSHKKNCLRQTAERAAVENGYNDVVAILKQWRRSPFRREIKTISFTF